MVVALSILGSAISLFSCRSQQVEEQTINYETLRTEYSENMSIIMSENGRKAYHFETPLIEGYNMAKDPYREFRKGIKITTFEDDSLGSVSAVLTANYAIFYENRKLWEAKGDVVIVNSDGRKLLTSQLFWNQSTHKVYSNVDSKIVGKDEVYHCEGFESDEQMKEWTYRKLKGVTYFKESDIKKAESSNDSETEQATASGEQTAQKDKAVKRPNDGRKSASAKPATSKSSAKSTVKTPASRKTRRTPSHSKLQNDAKRLSDKPIALDTTLKVTN